MSQPGSGRRRRIECGALPDDLYIVPAQWPRLGRPFKRDLEQRTVTDDWHERVPVTENELDVFEAWAIAAAPFARSPSASNWRTRKPASWHRERPAQDAGCNIRRKAGYARLAQFCSEMAEGKGFEPSIEL